MDSGTEATEETTGWPQARLDNGNTAYNASAMSPTTELDVAWMYDGYSGGVLVADGYAFILTDSEESLSLRALDEADGTEQWTVALDELGFEYVDIEDSMAVADGELYVTSSAQTTVFAVEDGSELRTFDVGGNGPKLTDDLVVVELNGLTAFSRADGDVVWSRDLNATAQFAVADGSVYAATTDATIGEPAELYALSLVDGSDEWTRTFESAYGFVAATDDTVFYWKANDFVVLDADSGETRWTEDGGELSRAEVENVWMHAVGDGVVYAYIDDRFGAFDIATGEELWSFEHRKTNDSRPVTGNAIYFKELGASDESDTLVVRNPDGEVVARHQLDVTDEEDRLERDFVAVDGMVFVYSNGNLVALTEPNDDSAGDESGGDERGENGDGDESGESGRDDDGTNGEDGDGDDTTEDESEDNPSDDGSPGTGSDVDDGC